MNQTLIYLGIFLVAFGLGGLAGIGLTVWKYKRMMQELVENPLDAFSGELDVDLDS